MNFSFSLNSILLSNYQYSIQITTNKLTSSIIKTSTFQPTMVKAIKHIQDSISIDRASFACNKVEPDNIYSHHLTIGSLSLMRIPQLNNHYINNPINIITFFCSHFISNFKELLLLPKKK